jgi:hypothetical protein
MVVDISSLDASYSFYEKWFEPENSSLQLCTFAFKSVLALLGL